MKWALNHMTTPNLCYEAFLDLARKLGCVGVEVRNDIGRPLFDGMDPEEAGKLARAKGLRLVGLSQVYPFNAWSDEVAGEVRALIATAKAAGAETVSLIPRNDGRGTAEGERQANLRLAMKNVLPMLEEADMTALVEPLGFSVSSLRQKSELVDMIEALGAGHRCKLVHDTFHHTLAGGGAYYPDYTGIVHISAVVDPNVPVDEMQDAHRVLIDSKDRLGNVEQIRDLLALGYDGVFSYECFSPETHALSDPFADIRKSFDFIASQVKAIAA
jgi:2-keto-myo-inositol isomerase